MPSTPPPWPAWWKYLVIGTLVMGQQFPAQLMAFGLPTIFRANGLPLDQMWVFQLATLPWWFKWLIAPTVDRYGSERVGRRRSWILPCTLLGAACYASLALIQPTLAWLWVAFGILFAKTLVMATQDVAVDGYTIDLLDRNEATRGSAVIAACEAVTYIAGYSGLLVVYDHYGWVPTMLAAAVLLLLFSLPALFTREPARPPSAVSPSLKTYLRRRDTPWVLGVLFAVFFGTGLMLRLEGAMLVDAGLSITQIGLLTGLVASTGSLVGSAITLWVVRRVGMQRAAVWGSWFTAAGFLTYFPVVQKLGWSMPAMAALFFTGGLLFSVFAVIYNGSRFAWSSKSQGGTDYSVQSALRQFSVSLAGAAGGQFAASFGWTWTLWLAIVMVLGCGLLYSRCLAHVDALVAEREAQNDAAAVAASPPSITLAQGVPS